MEVDTRRWGLCDRAANRDAEHQVSWFNTEVDAQRQGRMFNTEVDAQCQGKMFNTEVDAQCQGRMFNTEVGAQHQQWVMLGPEEGCSAPRGRCSDLRGSGCSVPRHNGLSPPASWSSYPPVMVSGMQCLAIHPHPP